MEERGSGCVTKRIAETQRAQREASEEVAVLCQTKDSLELRKDSKGELSPVIQHLVESTEAALRKATAKVESFKRDLISLEARKRELAREHTSRKRVAQPRHRQFQSSKRSKPRTRQSRISLPHVLQEIQAQLVKLEDSDQQRVEAEKLRHAQLQKAISLLKGDLFVRDQKADVALKELQEVLDKAVGILEQLSSALLQDVPEDDAEEEQPSIVAEVPQTSTAPKKPAQTEPSTAEAPQTAPAPRPPAPTEPSAAKEPQTAPTTEPTAQPTTSAKRTSKAGKSSSKKGRSRQQRLAEVIPALRELYLPVFGPHTSTDLVSLPASCPLPTRAPKAKIAEQLRIAELMHRSVVHTTEPMNSPGYLYMHGSTGSGQNRGLATCAPVTCENKLNTASNYSVSMLRSDSVSPSRDLLAPCLLEGRRVLALVDSGAQRSSVPLRLN